MMHARDRQTREFSPPGSLPLRGTELALELTAEYRRPGSPPIGRGGAATTGEGAANAAAAPPRIPEPRAQPLRERTIELGSLDLQLVYESTAEVSVDRFPRSGISPAATAAFVSVPFPIPLPPCRAVRFISVVRDLDNGGLSPLPAPPCCFEGDTDERLHLGVIRGIAFRLRRLRLEALRFFRSCYSGLSR